MRSAYEVRAEVGEANEKKSSDQWLDLEQRIEAAVKMLRYNIGYSEKIITESNLSALRNLGYKIETDGRDGKYFYKISW